MHGAMLRHALEAGKARAFELHTNMADGIAIWVAAVAGVGRALVYNLELRLRELRGQGLFNLA